MREVAKLRARLKQYSLYQRFLPILQQMVRVVLRVLEVLVKGNMILTKVKAVLWRLLKSWEMMGSVMIQWDIKH